MSQRGIIVSTGILLLVVCAPAQPVRWFQIEPPPPPISPPARYSHGMAFNAALGVVEMFGGDDSQTWAWDGTAWEMKSLTGPPSRWCGGLAYDSVRNVCVIFGGSDPEGYRDDTWEWDGTTWIQRFVPGPSPRAAHCLAFDPIRGVTVLFGGGDYTTTSGETWEWNGSTWTFRTSQGPGPRASAAMAFDPDRGVIVLHGGQSETGDLLGDLWEWDGSVWTQRSSAGPGRAWHSMVFDRDRHVAVFFGGFAPQTAGDTWEWDGQVWSQRATSGPAARSAHALAYDPIRRETLLFGGANSWGGFDDTWSWDGTRWTQRNLAPQWAPEPQSAPMTFDSVRGVTVLVGRGQTWEWDGAEWTLRTTDGPSQRGGHGLAFDRARGVTVLFGGQTGATYEYNAETWEWDGSSWTNRTVSGGPSPRTVMGMVFDASRGVIALFGGYGPISQYERATNDEYWEWNGTSWTQRIIPNPPWARYWHSMAFDSDRNAVVVYGGALAPLMTQWIGDLWELRAGTWTRMPNTPGPSPRIGTRMVYDPNRQVTVQFGGGDSVLYSSITRDWDGTTWTNWDIPGPEARMDAGMAYDEVRREIVLFGGWAGSPFQGRWVNDTWLLRESCVPYLMRQPIGGSTCAGNPFSLSIEADGGDSREYQWRKDGEPLTDVPGHIAGTLTPSLDLLETAIDDSGGYDCMVTNGCGSITSSTASLFVFDYPGDVTCDADVDLGDLAELLSNFGRSDAPPRAEGDLNRDGQVDLADLQILLGTFGSAYD